MSRGSPTRNKQTQICRSGRCFEQSSRWFPPQRGGLLGVGRDQRLLWTFGTLTD